MALLNRPKIILYVKSKQKLSKLQASIAYQVTALLLFEKIAFNGEMICY